MGRRLSSTLQREVDQYVADGEQAGLQVRGVFLTHFHADFVAGLPGTPGQDWRCGVSGFLCRDAEYASTPMKDGELPESRPDLIERTERVTAGNLPEVLESDHRPWC